ncbi:hypothetical protein T310_10095, partial [Rasamsonia emersonii CBS 393.64]
TLWYERTKKRILCGYSSDRSNRVIETAGKYVIALQISGGLLASAVCLSGFFPAASIKRRFVSRAIKAHAPALVNGEIEDSKSLLPRPTNHGPPARSERHSFQCPIHQGPDAGQSACPARNARRKDSRGKPPGKP